jgi:hypothetical protein
VPTIRGVRHLPQPDDADAWLGGEASLGAGGAEPAPPVLSA